MFERKFVFSAAGVGAVGLFAWVVMTQGPLAAVKVTVEKPQTGILQNEVFGIGTVEARRSYNLAPTATGRVNKVRVEHGDSVSKGQVLIEMDAVDLDDKLAGSRHALEKTANAIRAAKAQLDETQSRLAAVSATFHRHEELLAGGFVSREMFEAKRHEHNASIAAVQAAKANLETALQEQAKAKSELAGIGKVRSQTRLLSPVNGVVAARLVEPGSTLVGGQTALQVIDPKSVWVKTRIAQQQAGYLRAGLAAQILLRSQPQAPVAGKVARVEIISDTLTEERIVNVAFAVPRNEINLGEYAEVTIRLADIQNARTVSSAAVKRLDKQDGVWVLQNGEVLFKPVKIGSTSMDGRTQILEGLSNDDTVIVYSQQPLRSGLNVKVVPSLAKG
jgi:HlyD family secretion protein